MQGVRVWKWTGRAGSELESDDYLQDYPELRSLGPVQVQKWEIVFQGQTFPIQRRIVEGLRPVQIQTVDILELCNHLPRTITQQFKRAADIFTVKFRQITNHVSPTEGRVRATATAEEKRLSFVINDQ